MNTFTNRAAGIRGGTVPVTARLPLDVVEFMDSHLSPDLKNRGEIVQHAVAMWAMLEERRNGSA